jgi:hypothetical protein
MTVSLIWCTFNGPNQLGEINSNKFEKKRWEGNLFRKKYKYLTKSCNNQKFTANMPAS